MNSNEITFEDLHSRILNFIEKAQNATENIQFKFISKAGKLYVSYVGKDFS